MQGGSCHSCSNKIMIIYYGQQNIKILPCKGRFVNGRDAQASSRSLPGQVRRCVDLRASKSTRTEGSFAWYSSVVRSTVPSHNAVRCRQGGNGACPRA